LHHIIYEEEDLKKFFILDENAKRDWVKVLREKEQNKLT
jgi:hypothetical protein